MAIDTAQKRARSLGEGVPGPELLVPAGGLSTNLLRAQAAGDYYPDAGGGGGGGGGGTDFLDARLDRRRRVQMRVGG